VLTPHDQPPETPSADLIHPAMHPGHTAKDVPADATLFGTLLGLTEQMSGIGVPRALFGHDHEPDRLVCAFTAQKWIMLPDTPLEVRDAVWRYIIERVRGEGGDWQIYALVAQYYALKAIAVRLAPKTVSREKIRRANVEVTASFLVTCGRMQLRTPHVGARLVDQTKYHAEKAYWDQEKRALLVDPLETEMTGAIGDLRLRNGHQRGHPDFVLMRLIIDTAPPPPKWQSAAPVTARVVGYQRRRHANGNHRPQLKALDAELVARTRLERLWPPGSVLGLRKTIDDAAAEVDELEGGEVGKKRRQRAEAVIIRELIEHRRPSRRDPPPAETDNGPPS
jgi:hypothetical protein